MSTARDLLERAIHDFNVTVVCDHGERWRQCDRDADEIAATHSGRALLDLADSAVMARAAAEAAETERDRLRAALAAAMDGLQDKGQEHAMTICCAAHSAGLAEAAVADYLDAERCAFPGCGGYSGDWRHDTESYGLEGHRYVGGAR